MKRANLVVKQEVFNDTADDVCFVPVHPTPVLERFGSSVVQKNKTGPVAGSGVGLQVARDWWIQKRNNVSDRIDGAIRQRKIVELC